MRQFALRRVIACVLALFLVTQAVAQKKLGRTRRLLKHGTQAANISTPKVANTARQAEEASQKARQTIKNAITRKTTSTIPSIETRVRDLLATTKNPTLALPQVWQWQTQHNTRSNIFGLFALQLYVRKFGLLTPHLNKLFKQIAQLNNRRIENLFIGQMYFLERNKEEILQALTSHKIPAPNIRLRYTGDVDKITDQNFNAQKLVLSIEQRMNPVAEKDFSIRHINAQSIFTTASGQYAIYQYAGPIELIPSLYRYLLNNSRRAPITLFFDEEAKSLAMYNADKTLWLRVTPHEYENPSKLHIHLNEQRAVSFTDDAGKYRTIPVNINLSIPLLPPDNLPQNPAEAQRFLYEKLVLHPVKNLQGDRRVTIERRPIF